MPTIMKEAEIRARLVAALEADLIGPFVPDDHPAGGQEILPLAAIALVPHRLSRAARRTRS